MSSCIYLLTNTVNQKQYIGFTSYYEVRMKKYSNEPNENRHLTNAIKKYGWCKFTSEIIYMSEDVYHCENEAEVALIAEYDTFHGRGYNHTIGGGVCFKMSDETRNKMSKNRRKYPIPNNIHLNDMLLWFSPNEVSRFYGVSSNVVRSWKRKLNLTTCRIYTKVSLETKLKMSKNRTGINKGVPRTNATKLKISNANTKFEIPQKTHLFDMLKMFTYKQVSTFYGVSSGTIKIWRRKHLLTEDEPDRFRPGVSQFLF